METLLISCIEHVVQLTSHQCWTACKVRGPLCGRGEYLNLEKSIWGRLHRKHWIFGISPHQIRLASVKITGWQAKEWILFQAQRVCRDSEVDFGGAVRGGEKNGPWLLPCTVDVAVSTEDSPESVMAMNRILMI